MELIFLTKMGMEKLRSQLAHLIRVARPEAAEQLARAREQGDLSENAEYEAAREKLSSIDRQIEELQDKMSRVQVIDESQLGDNSSVRILSQVTLLNLKKDKQIVYTLVDSVQADPAQRMISIESPIGKGLLGKKVGEEIKINVPAGELHFKVLDIQRAEGF